MEGGKISPLGGLQVFLLDELLLPLLGGRVLARLAATCRLFAAHIHSNHEAWLSGHLSVSTSGSARMIFLDRLADACSICGTTSDITKSLRTCRQYFCSSCIFRHADRVRQLTAFDRELAVRVMHYTVSTRRRELSPIFASVLKPSNAFLGKIMAPAKLLFSTQYDGNALCMFFGLTANKPNTVLVMDTICGHRLGAFTPDAWKNFGDKPYGSKCTTLFSSYPNLSFFPATRDLDGYQLSSKSGIVLGPSLPQATIFISSNLDQGWTLPSGNFSNPSLLPQREFTLKNLEVWQLEEYKEEEAGASVEDPDDPWEDDFAKFRKKKKDSVLKNGVERFMLSFVGAGNALSVAMHMRNHT